MPGSLGTPPVPETAEGSQPAIDARTLDGQDHDGFPVSDWDRYVFVETLGRGGMGTVHRARDPRLGREVALKFIRGGDPTLTLRLVREARAQARIEHPNVCKVFEVGEVAGKVYVAMELVDGRPLHVAAPELSLHQKLTVVRDAARALHEAHTLGILHRDVKPGNIMVRLDDDGGLRAVVMDFGIARDATSEHGLTQTGALLGTPAYMSPEQARGSKDVDRRADVYSLGATLYELLSGEPPFRGETPVAVVMSVLHDEPTSLRARVPSVPEDVETIVAKCLHKDPGQRYDSARALADDLDRYVRGEPILGRRESWRRRTLRRMRRHRALVVTGTLALAGIAGAGGYALKVRLDARAQAAALEAEAALGRELAQDVEEIEWLLRTAHLLPLHDTTPTRSLVRARMAEIEARSPGEGMSAALVDYAVGRGHLALDELDEAHERLARAHAAGLDTPELHHALGSALGRLYERAADEARQRETQAGLEARLRELEAQYVEPALASLERAREARLESPSHLEGTIAFYRGAYDDAIALARRAREEAPWQHEAIALEAAAHLARAHEEKGRGDYDAADRSYRAATEHYAAAATIARSDARLREDGARSVVGAMALACMQGREPTPDPLPQAVALCESAAVARPDRTTPHIVLAQAHWQVICARQGSRRDPRPVLERVNAALDRALALDPDDVLALTQRAEARVVAGNYAMEVGGDVKGLLDEANTIAERLVALEPDAVATSRIFLKARRARALHAIEFGGDPVSDLEQASATEWALVEREKGFEIWVSILWGDGMLATWLVYHGRDPGPPTARSDEAHRRCVEHNPSIFVCDLRFAWVEHWRARHAFLTGGDPRPILASAHRHLDRADELSKGRTGGVRFELLELQIRDTLRRGEDASALVEALDREITECVRLAGGDPQPCWVFDAIRWLRVADVERSRGRPDRPALERAKAICMPIVAANDSGRDIEEVLAEVELRLAKQAATPAEAAVHRKDGLAACERGLTFHSDTPRLHALRGALLQLAAEAEAEPSARAELAGRALASLRQALEGNPLLRNELADVVAAAERLGGRAHP